MNPLALPSSQLFLAPPIDTTMNSHHIISSPLIHPWMIGSSTNGDKIDQIQSKPTQSINRLPSLVSLCQAEILQLLERSNYNSRMVKDLCKYVPEELLEPIFEKLIESKKINDIVLMIYLSPNRHKLMITNVQTIRNSIFKMIGYNCPNLVYLDLSDCFQISNSVIRTVLTGCSVLECLKLDRCQRITDSAFDFSSAPFQAFVSALSLHSISLQGCPQITGEVITIFNKNYRNLSYLNYSQCRHLKNSEIPFVFQHQKLKVINLSFIDAVTDEAFYSLPSVPIIPQKIVSGSNKQVLTQQPVPWEPLKSSPLQVLNLCKCRVTDNALAHFVTFHQLVELRLPWCTGITDAGMMVLVEYCPKLEVLDVTSCSITDLGLQSIGKLAKRQLRELDLSWCMEITNQGLRYLLPGYTGDEDSLDFDDCYNDVATSLLEKLSLVWCPQVNNDSLSILSHLNALKMLVLSGCNEVTTEAIQVFAESGIEIIQ